MRTREELVEFLRETVSSLDASLESLSKEPGTDDPEGTKKFWCSETLGKKMRSFLSEAADALERAD